MNRISWRAHVSALVVTSLAAACSSSSTVEGNPTPADESCSGAAPFANAGPNPAGVTTFDMGGIPVEVWYPASIGSEAGKSRAIYDVRDWLSPPDRAKIPDADAPTFTMNAYRDLPIAAKARYPLVLFSHGLGGYRSQSSVLMAHLASWGFIVAAPDHLSRGLAIVLEADTSKIEDKAPEQLRAALAAIRKEDTTSGSRFEGHVDASRVALVAHSQGGAAISDVVTDSDVTSWVLLASPGFGEGPSGKPLLMMGGTADAFAKVGAMSTSFERQPTGKRYVQIKDAVHLAFTDICAIGRTKGGPLAIARDHGIEVPDLALQLITDGCRETKLPVEKAWPVIGHYVTAELRATLHVDAQPRGLNPAAAQCFGERIANYQEN